MVVVLKSNLDGSLFGEIYKIIVGKSKILYSIIKPNNNIGFDSHICSFEIEKSSNLDVIGCYLTNLMKWKW